MRPSLVPKGKAKKASAPQQLCLGGAANAKLVAEANSKGEVKVEGASAAAGNLLDLDMTRNPTAKHLSHLLK